MRTAWRLFRVFVGLVLLAIATWGLRSTKRWTHGSVASASVLAAGSSASGALLEAPPDRIDSAQEGRVVHLVGTLTATPPVDSVSGASLPALQIRRKVEMLQWKEVVSKTRSRTYHFEKTWRSWLIDSDGFHDPVFGGVKHVNPSAFPYRSDVAFGATDLRMGPYRLSDDYAYALTDWRPVTRELLPDAPPREGAWQRIGGDAWSPDAQPDRIGSVRLSYEYVPLDDGSFSVIGRLHEGVLSPEGVLEEDAAPIPLIERGRVSATEMAAHLSKDAREEGGRERTLWSLWLVFGFLLSMRPAARLFHLFPKYTEAPFRRRIGPTLALAVVAAGMVLGGVMLL